MMILGIISQASGAGSGSLMFTILPWERVSPEWWAHLRESAWPAEQVDPTLLGHSRRQQGCCWGASRCWCRHCSTELGASNAAATRGLRRHVGCWWRSRTNEYFEAITSRNWNPPKFSRGLCWCGKAAACVCLLRRERKKVIGESS